MLLAWDHRGPPSRRSRCDGATLPELVLVTALVGMLGAIAMPQVFASLDEVRAAGAARYVSARLHRARMDALLRSADVGLRFVRTGEGYAYASHADGNRNGIRARDIQRGIDVQIWPPERLGDSFPGVDFGVDASVPAVDPGSAPPGTDPLKLGAGDIVSFSALGTSTSGSLYIRSRRGAQYVVKIFGATGKTRLLKFNRQARRWLPL